MSDLRRIGNAAEERAAEYLIEQGFTIVTRNAHSRGGEIDIVALDDEVLVFVEVKLRRSSAAAEAITPTKALRMRRAAREYLQSMGEPERAFRFDLVAIEPSGLRHYRQVLSQD